MADTSIIKINSRLSPRGGKGQKYLATGISMAMRLWDEEGPAEPRDPSRRDYETIGFVIKGRAELHVEGQMVLLEPVDSWVVPKGASHTYKIVEPFTAVEATHPPAQMRDRDHA